MRLAFFSRLVVQLLSLVAFIFATPACIPRAEQPTPLAGVQPSSNRYNDSNSRLSTHKSARAAPLGMVNGEKIYFSDLDSTIIRQIRDAENEQAQRRLHLSWVGFEEAIDQRLIAHAASHLNMSVAHYRTAEIESKIEDPSDEELQAIYELNKDSIPVPFAEAKETLTYQLTKQRRETVEQALSEALRADATIAYTLAVPTLPRYPVKAKEGARKGAKDAVVTVVEFSDFECPYCSRGKQIMEQLLALYPKKLAVVFRHFPLGQHKNAKTAAIAAKCAGKQGKFWPYHDLLFDHQRTMGSADLLRHAQQVELNMKPFKKCLVSPDIAHSVAADMADGRAYGVSGTPAIFINGIKLIGLLPMPLLKAIIDQEIANHQIARQKI